MKKVAKLPAQQFRLGKSVHLASVIGRPLVASSNFPALLVSGSAIETWIALRVVPTIVHILRDGEIMDVWKFPAEVIYLALEKRTVLVATAEGNIWYLPLPTLSYFLKTQRVAKTKPVEKGSVKKTDEKRRESQKETRKPTEEAPSNKKRRLTLSSKTKGNAQEEKGKEKEKQKERETKKQDKQPEFKQPMDVVGEALFENRGPALPLLVTETKYKEYILAKLDGIEKVFVAPTGVFVNSRGVGLVFIPFVKQKGEDQTLVNLSSYKKGATSMLSVFPEVSRVTSKAKEKEGAGMGVAVADMNRNLYAGLFGGSNAALNKGILLFGDNEGKCHFIPTSNDVSFSSPTLLFDIEEPVQNILLSGNDMLLIVGTKGKAVTMVANQNDVEIKEFHTSLPIHHSCCTSKHLVVLSDGGLYSCSLSPASSGQGESFSTASSSRRLSPSTLYPHAIPVQRNMACCTCIELISRKQAQASASLLPVTARKWNEPTIETKVVALSRVGRCIDFVMPQEKVLQEEMVTKKSPSISQSKDVGQRVKHLLEDIATISGQNEAIQLKSQLYDEKLFALNQAIRLVSAHSSSVKSRTANFSSPVSCAITADVLTNSSMGYPHSPCVTVSLTNNSDYDIDGVHWSYTLQVIERKIFGEGFMSTSYSAPLGFISKGGGRWMASTPVTLQSHFPFLVKFYLIYHFASPGEKEFIAKGTQGNTSVERNPLNGGVPIRMATRRVDVLDLLTESALKQKRNASIDLARGHRFEFPLEASIRAMREITARYAATKGRTGPSMPSETAFSLTLGEPFCSRASMAEVLNLLMNCSSGGMKDKRTAGRGEGGQFQAVRHSAVTFRDERIMVRIKPLSKAVVIEGKKQTILLYNVIVKCPQSLSSFVRAALLWRLKVVGKQLSSEREEGREKGKERNLREREEAYEWIQQNQTIELVEKLGVVEGKVREVFSELEELFLLRDQLFGAEQDFDAKQARRKERRIEGDKMDEEEEEEEEREGEGKGKKGLYVAAPLDVVHLAERVAASSAALMELYKNTRGMINELFIW